MIVKGAILFHRKFIYENDSLGKKLLVILNSPSKGEPFLFVKTTSRQNDKPKTPGCIEDSTRSLFYVPAKKDFFDLDTWVQMYTFAAFDYRDIVNSPDIKKLGSLKPKTVNDIVDCLQKTWGDNIAPWQKKLLQPCLNKLKLKLKEKYNKRRG